MAIHPARLSNPLQAHSVRRQRWLRRCSALLLAACTLPAVAQVMSPVMLQVMQQVMPQVTPQVTPQIMAQVMPQGAPRRAGAQAEPAQPPISAVPVALSAAERAWLAAHPRLRVHTKTEWAPIDLYTYEGQFRGLSGDYLALIGQRLGVGFEFLPAPTLAASLDALKRGDADILPSVVSTPQRDVFMDFTLPYLDVPNVYVTRHEVLGVGPDQAMRGLRVAVEQGYAVASLIAERHPQARIVEFADSTAALRGVSEGLADVYLGALPTTSFLVEKLLLSNLEVRGPSHSRLGGLRLGVHKGEALLLGLLDKALASITLAERQDIHRRWAPLHTLLAEPSPPLALAADERRLVGTLPALRIGYEADYGPYTLRTEDGQLAGMASETLHLMADKAGLRLGVAQAGSWSETYGRARRGEVDLLIAIAANEQRAREFLFIGPWISTPNVLVTPRDAAPVLSMAQYTGRRIAVLRDGQTAYLMRRLHPYVQLLEVDQRPDLLAAVANGRAEATLINVSFVAPMLAQGLGSALRMAAFFPEINSDLYFAVRRDQPQLAALLRRAHAALSEGERAAIASRWAALPEADEAGAEARANLQRLLPVLGAALVALLVSLLWGVGLRRAVARRKRAELAADQARDRALALARVRHDFLTEASHEIRTPVNAVVGALEQLTLQPLPPQGQELAALAQRAAQTLSEYVNNLLDLSKSDAGELRLVLQPDSLPATLHSAVQAIAPVARARHISVLLQLAPALAAQHVFDAFRLRQVVLNLLSNAVKFSAEHGSVGLQVTLLDDQPLWQRLRIEVIDEGPGIAAERLPGLFMPYAQAGETLLHRSGSSGLGLALCKRLVDAMQGRIALDSVAGRGTRVSVELNLARLPASALAGDLASTSAGAGAGATPTPSLQVLLADDDRVQQILLEALLVQAGCSVDVAADGQDAQMSWLAHRHRLVITDLHMPVLGGLAFARWLRAQPGGADVHLVGTSADLDDIAAARAAGIVRLLSKPVARAMIDDVVREAQTAQAQRAASF